MHHEDYLSLQQEMYVSNAWTPHDNMTAEELVREFDSSGDPVVQALVNMIGRQAHVLDAYADLSRAYDELYTCGREEDEYKELERERDEAESRLEPVLQEVYDLKIKLAVTVKEKNRALTRIKLFRERIDKLQAKVKDLTGHLNLYTKPISGLRKPKRPLHVHGDGK